MPWIRDIGITEPVSKPRNSWCPNDINMATGTDDAWRMQESRWAQKAPAASLLRSHRASVHRKINATATPLKLRFARSSRWLKAAFRFSLPFPLRSWRLVLGYWWHT